MYKELDQAWQQLTSPGQMFEVTTTEVRGVPLRVYANAPPSLREFWLGTAGHGDNEYLVYNKERCSYREAHAFTASIAHWLAANGVQPGDRVAIAMRNYP
ncbi:MAG: AMP-binding protein, partial [Chromatocurvus sp.]